jgi:acyl dehydratase
VNSAGAAPAASTPVGPVPTELTRSPSLVPLLAKALVTAPLHGDWPLPRVPRPNRAAPPLDSRSLSLVQQRIPLEHLVAYQHVCGFRASDVLPPTYLHLLSFPLSLQLMTARDFPFSLLGLVHVANVNVQTRPVRADELVSITTYAGNLRSHPAGQQLDIVSQASIDDYVVWRETSTYLSRGHGAETGAAERGPAAGRNSAAGAVAPAEGEPAVAIEPRGQWRVPADIGRRYATVSGDRNPIHLHPLTARLFGFSSAIAHGMWLEAKLLSHFEGRLPTSCTVAVNFKKPVLLPSTVGFGFERADDGWAVRISDLRTGAPHLVGQISEGRG